MNTAGKRFRGRTAIITGAGGSIGSAVARALAIEGANLCLAELTSVDAFAATLVGHGGQVMDKPTDVTQAAQVRDLFRCALDAFGRVDILVNVAGIVSFGSAANLAESEWDRVLDVNLKGTFLCCQSAIDCMRKQKYGRIINIGSVVGRNGGNARPWIEPGEMERAGNVAYGVSKAGVHALTVFLSRELAADGITVNAVAPGPVSSGMTTNFPQQLRSLIPVGRQGLPEEIADACLFLAQETSAFITAEILNVNGGMWPG